MHKSNGDLLMVEGLHNKTNQNTGPKKTLSGCLQRLVFRKVVCYLLSIY